MEQFAGQLHCVVLYHLVAMVTVCMYKISLQQKLLWCFLVNIVACNYTEQPTMMTGGQELLAMGHTVKHLAILLCIPIL